MASDPELQRSAGPSCHWPKAWQSRIDLQGKAVRNSAPWQHLQQEVLHFVCELRGPIASVSVRRKVSAACGSHVRIMTIGGYGSRRSPGRRGWCCEQKQKGLRSQPEPHV